MVRSFSSTLCPFWEGQGSPEADIGTDALMLRQKARAVY